MKVQFKAIKLALIFEGNIYYIKMRYFSQNHVYMISEMSLVGYRIPADYNTITSFIIFSEVIDELYC